MGGEDMEAYATEHTGSILPLFGSYLYKYN
jgi:hypothetical protein